MPRENKSAPGRVLVTRFSAIGDVAMTIPVLYTVCRANPATHFVMVTRPSMARMMVNPPDNLTLHAADVSHSYRGLGGMRRLMRELIQSHGTFDAMADLHNVLRTIMLGTMLRLKGVKVCRLNKARSRRRALTRTRNKILLPLTPQSARYTEVFNRLGLNTQGSPFTSIWGDGVKGDPAACAAITPAKSSDERWIAIAPFAAHRGKVYPPELMHSVVSSMAAIPGNRVFLFGGGDTEQAILSTWADPPNIISLAGQRHGFPVELALLSHMDAMVSMDSANMHLASLVGVRVVSVWGATHPYCGFRGHNQSDSTAVQLSMTCRPCSIFGNKPCHRGDYHCLAGISPAAIIEKVNSIINRPH